MCFDAIDINSENLVIEHSSQQHAQILFPCKHTRFLFDAVSFEPRRFFYLAQGFVIFKMFLYNFLQQECF